MPKTLTEHWDGTSWSIIPSPTSGGLDFLNAVAARSDGSVVAVGSQGNTVPLIYQNAASAPKAPTPAAVRAAPVITTATLTAVPTTTMPATPLDAAAVDQLFAATGPADKPLSFARHRSRAHQAADDGALDGLQGGNWPWNPA